MTLLIEQTPVTDEDNKMVLKLQKKIEVNLELNHLHCFFLDAFLGFPHSGF